MKHLVLTVLYAFAAVSYGQEVVPGRLLVGFKEHVTPEQAQNVMKSMGARSSRQIGDLSVHVVELPAAANPKALARAFQGRTEIEFMEEDVILEPTQITPNDPQYANQWHLPKIQAPMAWVSNTGSSAIKIAILDSGVDPTHEDLYSRLTPGYNTYDGNTNTADVYGHGTKVAGSAGASGNNGVGVAGVSWGTLIMPIRVTDTYGYATASTLAAGLNWAANNGARVANMSFDVAGLSSVSSAAQYFQSKGGVVFASAGNSGALSTVAASPYINTVSATDPNDLIYGFSTTGIKVTLSAPGCVTTTTMGNTYGSPCGTSFSSPIAAGVAALVLSANPNLTPDQVISILQTTADDLGAAGLDEIYGYGRVNAARAVTAALQTAGGGSSSTPTGGGGTTTPPPPPPPPADTTAPTITLTSPKANATISGNVAVTFLASDNVAVVKVELLVNGAVVNSSTAAPFTVKWNTNRVARGTYTLQGKAYDAAGNTALSNVVTVYR